MSPSIKLTKIWTDDDLIELTIQVSDGTSSFLNNVYASQSSFQQLVRDLSAFRNQVHGGLYDLEFGKFGPEYANGAFHARLHFQEPGRLYVSTHQESDFASFGRKNVASEAKMFLHSEPVLVDNFIAELRAIVSGRSNEASLVCTGRNGA